MSDNKDIKQGSKQGDSKNGSKRFWRRLRIVIFIILGLVLMGCIAAAVAWTYVMKPYSGKETWLKIPAYSSVNQVKDSLVATLGNDVGQRVFELWKYQDGTTMKAHGAYLIKPGDKSLAIARRLRSGRQTPVKGVWNNGRTIEDMAQKLTANLECTPEEFIATMERVLPNKGFTRENFTAAFIPDTYEFYWSSSPSEVVNRLIDYRDRFWTKERKDKAAKLGMTENEVVTLASIVEEESAKRDEYGNIARLYINRLQIDMPLQADPTLKYAAGDPSIRRLNKQHINIESPYNTYKYKGLPPGPIRLVDKRTIDAVLDAPQHDYLYMCAKEDFSGYHNFAKEYSTHLANAKRYQHELDRRQIH